MMAGLNEAKQKIDSIVLERGTGIRYRDENRDSYDMVDIVAVESIIKEFEIGSESSVSLEKSLLRIACRGVYNRLDSDELDAVFVDTLMKRLAEYDAQKNDSFYLYFTKYLRYAILDANKIKMKDLNMSSIEEAEDIYDSVSHQELAEYEATNSDRSDDKVNMQEQTIYLLDKCCQIYKKMDQDLALSAKADKAVSMKKEELRNNRMFFSDAVVDIFRNGNDEIEYNHERDLCDSLDDKYLECVFRVIPDSIKSIVMSDLRTIRELSEHFAGDDKLDQEFRKIFKGAAKYDEEIEIPCEARIFIATLFLHDLEDGDAVPTITTDASISRSRKRFRNRMAEYRSAWDV